MCQATAALATQREVRLPALSLLAAAEVGVFTFKAIQILACYLKAVCIIALPGNRGWSSTLRLTMP